jgi:hypothetical protein
VLIQNGHTDADTRREVYRQTGYLVSPGMATRWALKK